MQKILQYKKTLVFMALIGVLVGWYNFERPSATVRYKLTVEIDTPEGVKTGSAVREVTVWRNWPHLGGPPILSSVLGEAVVVDLGARGVVFALLRGGDGVDDARRFLEKALPNATRNAHEYVRYYKNIKSAKRILSSDAYPLFVYFRDHQDPKTVDVLLSYRNVGPAWNPSYVLDKDRFTEAFGEGVALKSVAIETTREPITTGVVEKFLPPPDGKPHLFTRDAFIRGDLNNDN